MPSPRFRTQYVLSILSAAGALTVLGIFLLLSIQGEKITEAIQSQVDMLVILNDSTTDVNAKTLVIELNMMPFVQKLNYVSKDSAEQQFIRANKEDFTDILNTNPLFSSIDINLKPNYANADSVAMIKIKLLNNPIISEIYYQNDLVNSINSNYRTLQWIFLGLGILLLLVTFLLIDSTTRLALYSQRFVIKTMQLVGATKWFIMKPYLLRGLLFGFVSGIIAALIVISLENLVLNQFPGLTNFQNVQWTGISLAGLIVIGIVFMILSSWIAVRKYLNKHVDTLY
jgi:cell division transport system permease protein